MSPSTAGYSWSTIYNQPTAQFYHLAVDDREPYSSTAPSRTTPASPCPAGPTTAPSPGPTASSPARAKAATSPSVPTTRRSSTSARSARPRAAATPCSATTAAADQIRLITTWPEAMRGYGAGEHRHRFAWTYPIVISPHDPTMLYVGGNQRLQEHGRGTDLGRDQPRLDPRRPHDAGADRRSDQPRLARRRDLRHRLRLRRIATRGRASSGPGRTTAGSTSVATAAAPGKNHPARLAGVDDDLLHRTLALRCRPPPIVAATRYKLDDYRPYPLRDS